MAMAKNHKKHKQHFNRMDLETAKNEAFEKGFEQGVLSGKQKAEMDFKAELDDSAHAHMQSYEKGVAVGKASRNAEVDALKAKTVLPVRRRLLPTRKAVTHRFEIGGHEGYMTVGMFEDGTPGELFVTMSKEGSTIGGLMDTVGTLTSVALQYGVSLETLVKKFSHQRFEPSGWSTNKEIGLATSIIDYVFRWMGLRFGAKPEVVVEKKQA